MSEENQLIAYCVKCKEKHTIANAHAVFTAKGQPATKGVCPVCGTNMFRMGRTEQHNDVAPPPKPEPPKPDGKLVIVESPTKARTIGRFLGKDYTVKASVGHIRDLLRSQLSVDVDNHFEPKYRIPNDKRAVVKELTKLAKKSSQVFLATDLDREGEAIAWHLYEVLGLTEDQVERVVFHEITKPAIAEAFAHPREINMDLVNAQQARRILDRLVGYNLSPLLWRKVRSRLSAGRVQSVALRLVVEREREIENFEPVEYWTIDAELSPQRLVDERKRPSFTARLTKIKGDNFDLHNQDEVAPIVAELEHAEYVVDKIKKGTRKRRPQAPYTTSTMQQDASRKLNFTANKTMRAAQQLYEGIETGDGQTVGLITYMRTDSTNIAPEAQKQARDFISKAFGPEFLPNKPPVYTTRSKGAQEAHEAIRPTSVLRTPKSLKDSLSRDQYRLYNLIWSRFVASQMRAAVYDTITVTIHAGTGADKPYQFRATGSLLRFEGYLAIYTESKPENEEDEASQNIPEMTVGELLDLLKLMPEQHFTQAPPRYSDASLIKTMEEYGIGRPSTYASILATIQQRGYVYRELRRYFPTDTGFVVNDLLVDQFPDLINVEFTALMESELDDVATGDRDWVAVLEEFYSPFSVALSKADDAIEKVEQVEYLGRKCPDCDDGQLIIRWGRYGKFIGCNNFPTCKYTEPWLEKVGVTCPVCGEGDVIVKRTRKGRTFYGCSRYPDCEFVSWKRPLPVSCPQCGGILVFDSQDKVKCTGCETTFDASEFEIELPEGVKVK